MASSTSILSLYKKDPITDENDNFDITTMLNENFDKIDASAGSLQTSIANIATQLAGLGAPTSKFSTLKWNSIGDSITAAGSYQSYANARLGLNTVRNYGVGGCYLASDPTGSNTSAVVFRYQNMDNDADIITVTGGTNDWGYSVPIGTVDTMDIKTIRGAVATIIQGLAAKYPGKYIIWMTLPQRYMPQYDGDGHNSNGDTTMDYAVAIKDVCRKYAVPCIDINAESGISRFSTSTQFLADGVHPNAAGYQRIAALIIAMFNKVVY